MQIAALVGNATEILDVVSRDERGTDRRSAGMTIRPGDSARAAAQGQGKQQTDLQSWIPMQSISMLVAPPPVTML